MTNDDEARAQQAKELAAIRRRLFVVSTVLSLAYPALLWLSGLSVTVWAWLTAGLWAWWALAMLLVLYVLAQSLVLLPLGYYGGHVVAHRFGLSRQSASGWLADWAKGSAIGLVLAVLVGLLFFWLVQNDRTSWWWIYGLILSAGIAFLSYMAPYVLVPLFYRMRPVEDQQLVQRLQALVTRAGVPVREICSLDFSRKTAEANAAVIGLGPSRRIVIADTLLASFSPAEVDSVVAHELGHHVHRDMPRLVAIEAGVMLIGLALANWLGLPLLERTSSLSLDRLAVALPLLVGAAQVYGLATMPFTNALSRAMEASADHFALTLTRDARAFVSAMYRLAHQNLVEERPPRWAEWLLYTHPPIYRRVSAAEEWARG